jgi:acyl dehydratase
VKAVYLVGREKVREFADAVGETDPRFHDVDAARQAGFADVVAPPMFAAVYAGKAVFPTVLDPKVGIDFSRMVHGGQEFIWHKPVVAGDEITTEAQFTGHRKQGDLNVFTFSSRSVDQDGELVCEGIWTNIVR